MIRIYLFLITLIRHWKTACFISWVVFFSFQIFIGVDNCFSKKPICSSESNIFSKWNLVACFAVLGGFTIIWSMLLSRILKSSCLKDGVPLMIYFNIVTMATIASFLSFTLNWGGLCIDSFGWFYNHYAYCFSLNVLCIGWLPMHQYGANGSLVDHYLFFFCSL